MMVRDIDVGLNDKLSSYCSHRDEQEDRGTSLGCQICRKAAFEFA